MYRPDGAFKSMRAEALSTAAEVLAQALQKFQPVPNALPGNEKDYRLIEVASDGGMRRFALAIASGALPPRSRVPDDICVPRLRRRAALHEFAPEDRGVVSRLTLCGRLYLRNATLVRRLEVLEGVARETRAGSHSMLTPPRWAV